MQGVSLNVPSEVFNGRLGTVLDSGTTYAYLPDKAFDAFKDAVSGLIFQIFCLDCYITLQGTM